MKQWAITVGINQYHWFQPLSYAQRDAQALQSFLVDEAGVAPDRCLLLTDTSPPVGGRPTYPNRENIEGWIDVIGKQCLQPGDVLWYFFSGYGVCHHGHDYLMPIDGDPNALDSTAIPLEAVFDRLKTVPAETMLVLLDMNRSEGTFSYETVGAQTAALADNAGIPTILSCQPGQFSREASALGHGVFTAALLESLRSPQCATLDRLDKYLGDRLPELSEHHWRPIQEPLTISPPEKLHQIILPSAASQPIWTPARLENGSQPQQNGSSAKPRHEVHSSAAQNGSQSKQPPLTSRQEALTDKPPRDVKRRISTGLNGNSIASRENHSDRSSSNFAASKNVHSNAESGNGSVSLREERLPPQGTAKLSNPSAPPPVTANTPEAPEDEIPDAVFWRPVQRWGTLAVSVLLVGVLLRNWTAMTQGTSSAPLIVAKPSPSAVAIIPSGNSEATAPQGERPANALPEFPAASGSASPEMPPAPANAATQGQIASARPTGLAAAQMAIKPRGTAPQGSFSAKLAGSTAQSQLLIPAPAQPPVGTASATAASPTAEKQATLSAKPAGSVAQGQPSTLAMKPPADAAKLPIKAPTSNSLLEAVKAKLAKAPGEGDASRFGYAIREASKIQPGQPDYPQAQQAIAGWSQEILAIARQRASQQKFDTAILATALVPQNQPAYPQARTSLKQWCKAVYLQRITNPIQQRQARDFCRTQVTPLP